MENNINLNLVDNVDNDDKDSDNVMAVQTQTPP